MKKHLTGDDIYILFHAALKRKCDSHTALALYYLIHLIRIEPNKFNPWKIFGHMMSKELKRCGKTSPISKDVINSTLDCWYKTCQASVEKPEKVPDGAEAALHAMVHLLYNFSNKEWLSIVDFLKE